MKNFEKITILHTNDFHSHLENFPKVSRFIQERKTELINEKQDVFLFDIGDFIDRLHPLTEASLGQKNTELLNTLNYDGVTIGNNEGLILSHDDLNQLYQKANFPVILANFFDRKRKRPKWVQPYKIFTTSLGTRIGVIGLTAPYELTYQLNGWHTSGVDETLEEFLPILKQQTDIIILLSHLGLPTDEHIAENFSDVDIIIGAHTHHLLKKGKKINNTLLAAAGRYGQYVGEILLEIDQHHLHTKIARTFLTEKFPSESEDKNQIASWEEQGNKILESRKVANLEFNQPVIKQAQDALIALKNLYQADISIISTGMFLKQLKKGLLTQKDLLEDIPHAIHPMQLIVDGVELKAILDESRKMSDFLENQQILGSGFRGGTFGKMIYLGLPNKIEDKASYKIATLDHYYFLPYFHEYKNNGEPSFAFSILLRELMGEYYASLGTDKIKNKDDK